MNDFHSQQNSHDIVWYMVSINASNHLSLLTHSTPHFTTLTSLSTTSPNPTNPPLSTPSSCFNLKAECSEHRIKVILMSAVDCIDPVKWEDVVFHESDDDELITVSQYGFKLLTGRDECCVED